MVSLTPSWLTVVTVATVLVFLPECSAATAPSCPITMQVNDGPEKHAVVKFSECTKEGENGTPSCGGVVKEITLIKNVTTDIG